MPIRTLDSKTALIVIDLQKGIVALPMCHQFWCRIDGCDDRAESGNAS